MKRIVTIVIIALIANALYAQTYNFDLTATVNKKYAGYSKGSVLHIKGLEHQLEQDNSFNASCCF